MDPTEQEQMEQMRNDVTAKAADKAARLCRSLRHDELARIVEDFVGKPDGPDVIGLYKETFEIVARAQTMVPILVNGGTRWKLAQQEKNKDDLVLLYWLPANTGTPFVTWMARTDEPQNTYWGHYHKDLIGAFKDFQDRLGGE
jgi:hypothetical protein